MRIKYIYKSEWREKEVPISRVVSMIRDGKYRKQVIALRYNISISTDEDTRIEGADRLPILLFGSRETPCVLLSFKAEGETLHAAFLRAREVPMTRLAFVGSSGRTLKVVIPCVGVEEGNAGKVYDDTFYQQAYTMAISYYECQLGLRCRRTGHTWQRGCRMSDDPNIYYYPDAIPMVVSGQWKMTRPKDLFAKKNMRNNLTNLVPGYTQRQSDMVRFQFCYQTVMEQHQDVDKMDVLLMELARKCQRSGLEQEFCVCRLLHITPFDEMEGLVRSVFNTIYRTPMQPVETGINFLALNQWKLNYFLQNNYLFRRNVLSGNTDYLYRGGMVPRWQPLTKEALNSITIRASVEGIVAWDRDVRRYVESEYAREYHPVEEYLNELPKWDGIERVRYFIESVSSTCEKWTLYFHVWLRSMVAQWIGRHEEHANTMVPLLVGAQGDGKSTFCRLILPPELRTYYTDSLDFSNRNEAVRSLSRYCLINIDEFDAVSKSQTAFLKHVIQKVEVKGRRVYSDQMEQRIRFASFIATTNHPMPLTDPSGSRRYFCVRLLGKIRTNTKVDYPQLYAQLLAEVETGMPCYFTREMEEDIQRSNRPFQQLDSIEEAFDQLFDQPRTGREVKELTATQVLQRLHESFHTVKVDNPHLQRLGRLLRSRQIPMHRAHRSNFYRLSLREEA